jgi:peptide-methionine (S)-S-oxide reductase
MRRAILLAALLVAGGAFAGTETATFAGGCFWSMQRVFDAVKGVTKTTVGYSGGHVPNPSYEQVSEGDTGHLESVQVEFDPKQVSYEQLLEVYWHEIDPTTREQEFCDSGPEYQSAIFFANDAQRRAAEASKKKLEASHRFPQIVTELREATAFYPAESYHQEYYRKNPTRYGMYRSGCGRDRALEKLWGKDAGH